MKPMIDRRDFLGMSTLLLLGCHPRRIGGLERGGPMHGLIGKIVAVEGSRDSLAEVLLEGVAGMPGCLSYVVAEDVEDPNALWVTEVWESQASHQASLSLPAVRAAIERGRPMIAGFGERYVTAPLGGQGLG
jgi:quinol monooxygenase YgiN